MLDKSLHIAIPGTSIQFGIFSTPLEIALAVAGVVVISMAAVAFTRPRLYQQWFVRVLWVAFAVVVGGSAYCWGVSGGIVEAFDISQDLSVALAIHDMAYEWRRSSLWFSLGFLVFCVLHFFFGYLARWAWHRAKRKEDERLSASDASTEDY